MRVVVVLDGSRSEKQGEDSVLKVHISRELLVGIVSRGIPGILLVGVVML